MLLKYLQGGSQENGARLFSVVPRDRTRGNGHKLKQRKFQLSRRKSFFPLRVTEPWPRLPWEVVESPSLEIFKPHLDMVLCSLLWVTHRGPFQPLPSCDSVKSLVFGTFSILSSFCLPSHQELEKIHCRPSCQPTNQAYSSLLCSPLGKKKK